MKDMIEEILAAAVQAPSGDNMQPWRFVIKGTDIHIFNLPERDRTLYNFRQRGSFVAHGALIENILIAAVHFGYTAAVTLFPNEKEPDYTARIKLEKSAPRQDPLFEAIFRRATNRKPYETTLLSIQQKQGVLASAKEVGRGEVRLIESSPEKRAVAVTASVNEQILFENYPLHRTFFENIVWTDHEEQEKKKGLYIKTLELPPPALAAFRLFRFWPALQFFNILGLSSSVARANAKLYASSAAIGAIIMPSDAEENFILTGNIVQRIWLKATQQGLNMQVMAGIIYLAQRIAAGEGSMLSIPHQQRIRQAYETMENIFGVTQGIITILFRIGRGEDPSAHSSRLPPVVTHQQQ